MSKVLFSGSFDPITNGHMDIIFRLLKMYDLVYVAIAVNPKKTYMFSESERINFISSQIPFDLKGRVIINLVSGLIVEYAYENGITTIARGIRNSSDFENELSMANINRELGDIDTICLPTKPELAEVSSSNVKAIAKEFGDISKYVSLRVKHNIEHKNGIGFISMVGGSGVGKSTLISSLYGEALTFSKYDLYHIDMDRLAHAVYESNSPYTITVKRHLIDVFGSDVVSSDGNVNRKVLGGIVFNDKNALNALNYIMSRPMKHLLYNRLKEIPDGNNRIVILDGAVIAENGSLGMSNNNVINVYCNPDIAAARIMRRDNLTELQAYNRINSQISNTTRLNIINTEIASHDYGRCITVNTDDTLNAEDIFSSLIEMVTP